MKRRLKLTPFAKIIIAILIIVGARYVYLNQENIQLGDINSIEKIKEKAKNIFNNKIKEESSQDIKPNNTIDTITIYITDSDNYIKISTLGKTVNKLKNVNKNTFDTLLFNISKEKALIGKIIYKKK